MTLMGWEKIGTVAKITMTAGKNLHNPTYIAALLSTFDEIEADEEVKAVVLTADDEKNFSQGIDLEWILGAFGDTSRHGSVAQASAQGIEATNAAPGAEDSLQGGHPALTPSTREGAKRVTHDVST